MATFHEFGDTGLSTMLKEIADEHLTGGLETTELRVPVTTLAAVTDDLGDQQVHFLKIDVEGYERQVLRGANFGKVRLWIVLIEAVRPMTSIPRYRSGNLFYSRRAMNLYISMASTDFILPESSRILSGRFLPAAVRQEIEPNTSSSALSGTGPQLRATAKPRCTPGRAIIASYQRFTLGKSAKST
jgi:hypothetical protein